MNETLSLIIEEELRLIRERRAVVRLEPVVKEQTASVSKTSGSEDVFSEAERLKLVGVALCGPSARAANLRLEYSNHFITHRLFCAMSTICRPPVAAVVPLGDLSHVD